MERRVKERLVGATVLVAAAVILIPEMLSGPKRIGDTTAKRGSDEPFKTYTIDLNRSPGAPAAAQTAPQTAPVEEAAPPPETESSQVATEQPTSAPDSESPAEEPAPSAQASPESASPQTVPPAQTAAAERSPEPAPRPREEQASAPRPATPPQPQAVASRPAVPTSKGWAVQLGSFASRPTADRIAKEFSGSGQAAFVMPVKSGANTLYRVRVGPFADRADANNALVGIKKRVANAAVVAHP